MNTLLLLLLPLFGLLSPSQSRLSTVRRDSDYTSYKSTPIIAHFIVGNSYRYSKSDWAYDIGLASSKGIDAFALNVGVDAWESDRVADAYEAAQDYGTSFKLFLSFDMTSLPCSNLEDANPLQQYIDRYKDHPNQLIDSGKTFVSTFSGETCHFGQETVDKGWMYAVKAGRLVSFFPAFFVDPATLSNYNVIDGAFNWNAAWPMDNSDANFDSDNSYLRNLGDGAYMAAVSPWFFTHYGPDTFNKNFIYRTDDWHISARWELLFQNRDRIKFVQVLTWNDFGESHYVGPVEGTQPNSEAWTDGFDHQAWLDLMQYYISAFKTGTYPPIFEDKLFLWARLYPAAAEVTGDSVGRPKNWEWTNDFLWAIVMLTEPAEVTLSCDPSSETTSLQAGVSKLKLPLTSTCNVRASIWRDGGVVSAFEPESFTFSTQTSSNYNFNAFVAALL